MQPELSEQLLTNFVSRTPIRNITDTTITWAPRKEKFNFDNSARFCRRCSPKGKDCDCSETCERNAQRCLNFFESEEGNQTELNMEFTPYSSRVQSQGSSISKTKMVENKKNICECEFAPRLNSKRKLLYAKAMPN